MNDETWEKIVFRTARTRFGQGFKDTRGNRKRLLSTIVQVISSHLTSSLIKEHGSSCVVGGAGGGARTANPEGGATVRTVQCSLVGVSIRSTLRGGARRGAESYAHLSPLSL